MEYGNFVLESQYPRWCYSTEYYNGRRNDCVNIVEEKLTPQWFYSDYSHDCKEYRGFTNNICSDQPSHKVSLSCVNLRKRRFR